MVEFLRWLFHIKAPHEIEAEVRRDKVIRLGEASANLGERVASELENIERKRASGRR